MLLASPYSRAKTVGGRGLLPAHNPAASALYDQKRIRAQMGAHLLFPSPKHTRKEYDTSPQPTKNQQKHGIRLRQPTL
jgi:hypothetical protein